MLAYYLYKLPPEQQYKKYDIPKRTGGTREIYAPISGIKQIQKRLSHILQPMLIFIEESELSSIWI